MVRKKLSGKSRLSGLESLIGYLRLILSGIPCNFFFVSIGPRDRFLPLGLGLCGHN
jgi:hypothetical protein